MEKVKGVMFDQKDIDRFWSKVRKRKSGCWEWVAANDNHGYGVFMWKGKTYKANIFSFMIANEIILEGREIVVRHTCNNPSCVNPVHLIDGTQKDNVHDAIKTGTFKYSKGRPFEKGENHLNAILTEEEVRKIRQLGWHLTATQIARMPEWKNKISRRYIWDIINYENWKHIE